MAPAHSVDTDFWLAHSVAPPAPPVLASSGLLPRLRDRLVDYYTRQWDVIRQAPPGTAKHAINRGVTWALSNITHEEETLRRLAAARALLVLHPEAGDAGAARAQRLLLELAHRCGPRHRRGYGLSVFATLLLSPLVVLPLPTFPLYWAAFRVWGNLRALQGAGELKRLLKGDVAEKAAAVRWRPCSGASEGECCRAAQAWAAAPAGSACAFAPCKLMDELHEGSADVAARVEQQLAAPELVAFLAKVVNKA